MAMPPSLSQRKVIAMPVEAIAGVSVFVVMFAMLAVIPTYIKDKANGKKEGQ